jgi:hypothetical protein
VTFETYWPDYLRHHANRANRRLHFFGWLVLISATPSAVATRNQLVLLVGIVTAYTFAWVGHFVFQQETPQTFRHPLLANVASLRMFALMATGRLGRHLARHGIIDQPRRRPRVR